MLFRLGWAEPNRDELWALCRSDRPGEALALVRRWLEEAAEPTGLAFVAQAPEATALLNHPKWLSLQQAYFARLDDQVLQRGQLAYEFECRAIKDQWVRRFQVVVPSAPSFLGLDWDNTQRLREVVASQGWPRISDWGQRGAQAAWLILQHSPDQDFQARLLPQLAELAQIGEVSASDYALLYDRVQVRRGLPQRYGSQVHKLEGLWTPIAPVEDSEQLDRFRSEVGLPPIKVYLEQVRRFYDPSQAVPERKKGYEPKGGTPKHWHV